LPHNLFSYAPSGLDFNIILVDRALPYPHVYALSGQIEPENTKPYDYIAMKE
jgi:hypothetical protein